MSGFNKQRPAGGKCLTFAETATHCHKLANAVDDDTLLTT